MVFSGAPLKRLYAQVQSVYNIVPNTSGTWNSATAKLIPFTTAELRPVVSLIEADYKTGTPGRLPGSNGRAHGSFSIAGPIMPSGTPGTKPNQDPVLQSVFGQAPTVVAATSVTYNLIGTVASPPLLLGLFNESGGSTSTSYFGFGGTPSNFTVSLGGNGYVAFTADGDMFYVLDSDYFASEDTIGKGGLTAFPAEPGSPALAGNQVHAFVDTVSFGGASVVEFVSAQIAITTGRQLRMDGTKYPTGIAQGLRSVSLRSLKFGDSDGSGLQTVKNAAKSKTPMDVIITQGVTAGSIITHTLKSIQFGAARFSDDGSGVDIDFDESPAHITTIVLENEYVLAFT